MARSLQVKTLKGESFQIEVAPEAVMSDVKAKISEQRGVDPASQVLICGGKTLKDGDALASSVAAGGFLVLMVKAKRRATPVATKPSASSSSSSSSAAPAAATAAPAAASAAAAAAAPPPPTASASATPAAAAASTATTAAARAAPAAAAAAAAATAKPAAAASATPAAASTTTETVEEGGRAAANAAGEELAIDPASVEMLTAMGFPEDQARAALRAAFNDVSRAASYLMEGIPEEVAGSAAAAEGAPSDARDDGDEGGEDDVPLGLGLGGGGNPLNFLRFHPQFDQLRSLVRDNPAMLPQVLQQLGAQSPELMERINQHPGDFVRLMNEPPDVEGQAMMEMGIEGLMDGMEQEDDDEADAAAAGFAAEGGEGRQGRGQQVTVELTEEEETAVQNLMSMVPGVGRDQVIEAFIACDKNAELAANLLFENAF